MANIPYITYMIENFLGVFGTEIVTAFFIALFLITIIVTKGGFKILFSVALVSTPFLIAYGYGLINIYWALGPIILVFALLLFTSIFKLIFRN